MSSRLHRLNIPHILFGGTKFCCCLPLRLGLISMAFLGMLIGGVLSLILWFQVAHSKSLDKDEKAQFVAAALLETFLFVTSILGFIGAIVRKQLFVQIYVYFTYLHFLISLVLTLVLLFVVTKFANTAMYKACMDTIQDTAAQEQCRDFLKAARGIVIGVAVAVLIITLYGAIIAGRYLNMLKGQKKTGRESRLKLKQQAEARSSYRMERRSVNTSDTATLVSPNSHSKDLTKDFDPYEEARPLNPHSSSGHDHEREAGWRDEEREVGIEEQRGEYYDPYNPRDSQRESASSTQAPTPLPRYSLSDPPFSQRV